MHQDSRYKIKKFSVEENDIFFTFDVWFCCSRLKKKNYLLLLSNTWKTVFTSLEPFKRRRSLFFSINPFWLLQLFPSPHNVFDNRFRIIVLNNISGGFSFVTTRLTIPANTRLRRFGQECCRRARKTAVVIITRVRRSCPCDKI